MQRIAAFLAILGTCANCGAQTTGDGGANLGGATTPYQPKVQSAPVQPTEAVRGAAWPGSNAPAAAVSDEISEEEKMDHWRSPKGGVPNEFTGTEVVARIGSQIVLASELMIGVEDTLERAKQAGQLADEQVPLARHTLMKRQLISMIDTKMLLVEALQNMPKENMPKIEKRCRDMYEKEQVPKLIDGKKIKSRAELIALMKASGTSLEEQQRIFYERTLATQWLHQQVEEKEEITHEQMLAWYREHLTDYDKESRAKWEHLMARSSNYASKGEAYAKLAEWGNLIFSGMPFSEVAKQHSDDPTSADGGMHDWTIQGSLASEAIDQAIFTLPVGQLSAILEDHRGFHIVRVVAREEAHRTPFNEVQNDIKKKIKADREGVQMKAYLEKLRKRMPVWTIFGDINQIAQAAAAGGETR